jgi:arylsulfatase A-like enzyme
MAEASKSRRRVLLSLGALVAGSATVATWPSRSPGTPVLADDAPIPTATGMGPPPPQGTQNTASSGIQERIGESRPNLILIHADDVGWGEVGAYGQKKIKTPNLDRLAREGLRFTDAYASSPVCAPDRASMFTGMHSGHTVVRTNPQPGGDLPLGPAPTIASVLRERGYRTGLFGKWGFGRNRPSLDGPNSHGFTDFFGYLTHHRAHDYYPTHLWQNEIKVPLPGNTGERGLVYGPDLIMERALEFLRNQKDDPFLLMLTPTLAHAPSVVPDLGQYGTKEGWTEPDKGHAAQMSRLDDYVGQVVNEVHARGWANNTIILFTSDNGPHEEGGVDPDFFNANGPFRGYKRNLYDGGIRVPFIVWSPKLLQRTAGKKTAHPTAHYDLLPTLADFAGAETPAGLDGLSLKKVFTGQSGAPKHRYLYWARLHVGSTPKQRREDHGKGRRAAAAVRFGRWKLVGFAPGEDYSKPGRRWDFELYDLVSDPGETDDVAGWHPILVRKGTRYLREAWWVTDTEPRRTTGRPL